MNVLSQLGLQVAGAAGATWLDSNYADKSVDVGPVTLSPGALLGVGVAVAAGVLGSRLPGRDVLVNLAGGMIVVEGAKLLSEQVNPYLPQPGAPAQLPTAPPAALPPTVAGAWQPAVGCSPTEQNFAARTAIGQQMARIRASYQGLR